MQIALNAKRSSQVIDALKLFMLFASVTAFNSKTQAVAGQIAGLEGETQLAVGNGLGAITLAIWFVVSKLWMGDSKWKLSGWLTLWPLLGIQSVSLWLIHQVLPAHPHPDMVLLGIGWVHTMAVTVAMASLVTDVIDRHPNSFSYLRCGGSLGFATAVLVAHFRSDWCYAMAIACVLSLLMLTCFPNEYRSAERLGKLHSFTANWPILLLTVAALAMVTRAFDSFMFNELHEQGNLPWFAAMIAIEVAMLIALPRIPIRWLIALAPTFWLGVYMLAPFQKYAWAMLAIVVLAAVNCSVQSTLQLALDNCQGAGKRFAQLGYALTQAFSWLVASVIFSFQQDKLHIWTTACIFCVAAMPVAWLCAFALVSNQSHVNVEAKP